MSGRSLVRRARGWMMRSRRGPSTALTWRYTDPLDGADRARLRAAGVPESALSALRLRRVEGPFPAGWIDRGNRLYVDERLPIPVGIIGTIVSEDGANALVCLGSDVSDAAYLFARGDGATFFLGPDSRFPHCEFHCGASSTIVLEGFATATFHATLDARNGGLIHAEPDQLWATDVIISTDDMHRIEDATTGERINAFGARIRLGRHVWIGRDSVVTGNTGIGGNSIVGARSFVRGRDFPSGVVLAGTPAAVIRDGVTWSRDDLP